MGNCQAVDAAALVIQHPCGRMERMYWPISASEVMKMNPGHYVSLIIPLPPVPGGEGHRDDKTVRFTRVKLLRPNETLALGHAYRLITSQEVMKVLKAKKHAKMEQKRCSEMPAEKPKMAVAPEEDKQDRGGCQETDNSDMERNNEESKYIRRHRPRTGSMNSVVGRSKSWRPTLQVIEEGAS